MKKIILSLVIIFCLFMTGCNKKTSLIEINYDELATKIENKESFVLYVGSATCSHCSDFKPILEKAVNKYQLEVYYIDLSKLSDSKHKAVMDKIDGEGTPTTVYLEKGKTKVDPRIEGARDYETIIQFFKNLKLLKGE